MPAKNRVKTNYPGVYYVESKITGSARIEKIYYIIYRRKGKLIEEKAGRQYQDDMTPARASKMRTNRIEGKQLSNTVQREIEKGKWTINRLWEEYTLQNPLLQSRKGFLVPYLYNF